MKYAVLVVLCFLAVAVFAQVPAPTNTTDFVPSNVGGNPQFAVQAAQRVAPPPAGTPPPPPPAVGSQYNNALVIADNSPASLATLKQNQVGVYFVNGQPKYVQNVPQPGFVGEGTLKAPQNSDCFNGKVEDSSVGGTEICDYGRNTCCDVSSKCSKWLVKDDPCKASDTSIPKTEANLHCYMDSCQPVNDGTGAMECVRGLRPAGTLVNLPINCDRASYVGKKKRFPFKKCRQNPLPLQKQKTLVNFTICFKKATTTSRLAVRGGQRRKAQRRGRKKGDNIKNNKRDSSNVIYCDGKGFCPCAASGCSQTVVLPN